MSMFLRFSTAVLALVTGVMLGYTYVQAGHNTGAEFALVAFYFIAGSVEAIIVMLKATEQTVKPEDFPYGRIPRPRVF